MEKIFFKLDLREKDSEVFTITTETHILQNHIAANENDLHAFLSLPHITMIKQYLKIDLEN